MNNSTDALQLTLTTDSDQHPVAFNALLQRFVEHADTVVQQLSQQGRVSIHIQREDQAVLLPALDEFGIQYTLEAE